MTNGGDDAKLGAEKRGAKLGDKFLPVIAAATPFSREVTVEASCMPGPVPEFVKLGPVPVDRLK